MRINDRKKKYLYALRTASAMTLCGVCVPVRACAAGSSTVCLADKPFDFELPLIAMLILLAAAVSGFIVWLVMNMTVIRRQTEELRHAKEDALAANTAKTRFLANISNDLLTPINTIAGTNELAMREDASEVPTPYFMSMMNYCFDIRDASESLLSLINDLLEMSNIESGRAHLEEQTYDTADMLGAIVKKIKSRCDSKGLAFEVCIDELLPARMYGDTGKITQILTNLLSNAVKYTQAGSVTFSVSMQQRENQICTVRFSVKDTGTGIKGENIDRIFKVYDSMDEQIGSGKISGLGLDISHRFAELMKGTLTCKSEYGKGSEFTFILEQTMTDQTPIGDIFAPDKITGRGRYIPQFIAPDADILVIDDDPKSMEIIKAQLKDTNVFVSSAASVEDGLERIKDTNFNVIFIDQMMLRLDSGESISRLRSTSPDLPVYILTSNATSGEMHYTSRGFTGYLSKPVDSMTLERTILKHIPESMRQESAEAQEAEDMHELPQGLEWINETEGISLPDGISNAGGTETFVRGLKMFCETIDTNARTIRELHKSGNMKRLTLKIRSIGHSAKIIGAMGFSELAAKLEAAGNMNDKEYIDENIDRLLTEYEAFRDRLSRMI